MPLVIPIDPPTVNVDDYRLSTALDGSQFVIDLSWSHRSESWYLDIYAVQGQGTDLVPVLASARLSCWYPLLLGVVNEVRPAGELMVWDMTGLGNDPTHTDLGSRVLLAYYTAAELGRG